MTKSFSRAVDDGKLDVHFTFDGADFKRTFNGSEAADKLLAQVMSPFFGDLSVEAMAALVSEFAAANAKALEAEAKEAQK